jgi:hypothetical protein
MTEYSEYCNEQSGSTKGATSFFDLMNVYEFLKKDLCSV